MLIHHLLAFYANLKKEIFEGAVDSAIPCALLIQLAHEIQHELERMKPSKSKL